MRKVTWVKRKLRIVDILIAIPTIKEMIREGGKWDRIKYLCEPLGLTDTAFRDNPNVNDFLLDEKYWLKEIGLEYLITPEKLKVDKLKQALNEIEDYIHKAQIRLDCLPQTNTTP